MHLFSFSLYSCRYFVAREMEVGKHKRINQIDLLYHPHFHIALVSHYLQYHRTAIITKLEQGDGHFDIY